MNDNMTYLLEGQESERLLFRKLNDNDFDAWLIFCQNEESVKFLPFLSKFSDPVRRCEAWFERIYERYTFGTGGMNVLINKTTNELVGQCGLLVHEVEGIEELEIGYSIMPTQQGKGYATEAAGKCRDFAFENNFRETLISLIDLGNNASAKVATNNGMKLERAIMYNGSPINLFRINKKQTQQ